MFERFTDRARKVSVLAQEEARRLNHDFIGTEHLLLGLIREGEGLAATALESLEISLEAVRSKVEETIGFGTSPPSTSPPFTPRAKKSLELALREALQLGHNYIGTEHVLLGLLREGEGVGAGVLKDLGADFDRVRERVVTMLAGRPSPESASVRGRSTMSVWLDYPTRVLSGPSDHLGSDGLEFSLTGVLLFDDAVQVFWGLSGIPERLAEAMKDTKMISPFVKRDDSVVYVGLSDDLATNYKLENASVAPRTDDSFVGRSRFTPAPPRTASRLILTWMGASIAIEL